MEEALRGCPEDVAAVLCLNLSERLAPLPADVGLARRTFVALAHPDVLAQPVLAEWLSGAFEQVTKWRRRDLAALGQTFEGDEQLARSFRAWRDAHRGALTRKLLGGGSRTPEEQS